MVPLKEIRVTDMKKYRYYSEQASPSRPRAVMLVFRKDRLIDYRRIWKYHPVWVIYQVKCIFLPVM